MADRRYVSIPADSTGKKVLLRGSYDVLYKNKSDTMENNDRVTITTNSGSDFQGVIVQIHEITPTTGRISLMLDQETIDKQLEPIEDGSIQINASQVALVSDPGYDIFSNSNTLVSYDDPYNGQLVDERGAAFQRFAEGSPQLDSFGRLRVSNSTTLGNYNFEYNRLSVRFSDLSFGGTIDHSTVSGAVILACSTVATDTAIYQSNVYHYYQPGTSQLIRCTLAAGDEGKANLERQWGYYDDDNGIFFKQTVNGMYVVRRSNTTGVVLEEEFHQSTWNVDRLDGSKSTFNKSYAKIDSSKINMYWIDMQWNGRIRMGIELDGGRIVCHEIFEANMSVESKLRTPNLPFRIEQHNTAATGSSSELRIWTASVHNESQLNFDESSVSITGRSTKAAIVADTCALAVRPGNLHFDLSNKLVALMDSMSVSSFDSVTGERLPVTVDVYQAIFPGTGVVGGAWVNADNGSIVPGYNVSAFEVNNTGTFVPAGLHVGQFFVYGAENDINLDHIASYEQNPLVRWGNGIQPEIVFVVSPIVATQTPDVNVSVTWKEIG